MSHARCFKLNHPFVVSETIDGEAVIMNLKSGHYYSARDTAALLWVWLEQGRSEAAIGGALAERYGGSCADYRPGVEAFIASLLEQGLVSECAPGASPGPAADAEPPTPPTYRPPVLEVFADLQDLLLLDPIHDTDDVGWPVAKPARPGSP